MQCKLTSRSQTGPTHFSRKPNNSKRLKTRKLSEADQLAQHSHHHRARFPRVGAGRQAGLPASQPASQQVCNARLLVCFNLHVFEGPRFAWTRNSSLLCVFMCPFFVFPNPLTISFGNNLAPTWFQNDLTEPGKCTRGLTTNFV